MEPRDEIEDYEAAKRELSAYGREKSIEQSHIPESYSWLRDKVSARLYRYLPYTFYDSGPRSILDIIFVSFELTTDGGSYIYSSYISWDRAGEETGWISTGPIYQSWDGEYRHNLVTVDQVLRLWKFYEREIELLSQPVRHRLASGEWRLDEFVKLPGYGMDGEKVVQLLRDENLAVKLLVITVSAYYWNLHGRSLPSHVDEKFISVIHRKEDEEYYYDLIEQNVLTRDVVTRLTAPCSDTSGARSMGYKFYPLTLEEKQQPMEVTSQHWKEIFIYHQVTKAVASKVCPSFPQYCGWVLIQGIGEEDFNNEHVRERFEVSRSLHHSATDIERAMRFIQQSGTFNEAADYLSVASSYVKQKGIVTDTGLLAFMEHVGNSLASSVYLTDSDDWLKVKLSDERVWDLLLFQLTYAFYVLHSKVGVIHGDPHANNLTIDVIDHEESCQGYLLDGKLYSFPGPNMNLCVIDFSRSVIINRSLIEKNFGSFGIEGIMTSQAFATGRLVKRLPGEPQHLQDMMVIGRDVFFKIFSAIDLYLSCSAIRGVMTEKKLRVPPKVSTIIDRATDYMESMAEKWARKKVSTISDFHWLDYQLLTDLWPEYETHEEKNCEYSDVYNFDNDLRYSVEPVSDRPPYMNLPGSSPSLSTDYVRDLTIWKDRTLG